jgi:hypothetical protein
MATTMSFIIPLELVKKESPVQSPIAVLLNHLEPGIDSESIEIFPDGHPTTLSDARPIDNKVKTNDIVFVQEVAAGSSPPDSIGQTATIHTKTSTVLIPPSKWLPMCHPRMEEVAKEIDGVFLSQWEFPTEKAKKTFLAAGFSRVTCLYFPKALDDRIHFACRLLTILFLIDGMQLSS